MKSDSRVQSRRSPAPKAQKSAPPAPKVQQSAPPAPKLGRKAPAVAAAPDAGRRIQVRRSGVHGKGIFALRDLAVGEDVIEYVGEIISWDEALARHPHDPSQPNHTFYFSLDGGRVIDANVGGNAARWINHSCNPNCEASEDEGRVFIRPLRRIRAGEELSYDYGLILDEPLTPKLKAEYACWCGSTNCRRTLLAPKRRSRRDD